MPRRKQTADETESTNQAIEPDVIEPTSTHLDTAPAPVQEATPGAFVGLNARFQARISEIYQRRANLVEDILDREEGTNSMLEQALAVSQERAEQLELFVKLQGLRGNQATERVN